MDAYFDCFAGISGNMVLGALLDLGLDRESWQRRLNGLQISDEYSIDIESVNRSGITGRHVRVNVTHGHQRDHHNHISDNKASGPGHEKEARHLEDIERLLAESELSAAIKESILEIFTRLAEAEGHVHDLPPEDVHFHEVGAVDAIVDIAGAVIGLDMLEVERIISSPLHTGTGFVDCAHGRLPVPAPAVLELLEGVPVFSEGVDTELVTPTGAAIITSLADDFGERPEMEINSTGYGAGSKGLDIPNLLRVTLGEFETVSAGSKKTFPRRQAGAGGGEVKNVARLSTNIDDMNPELYGHVMDLLLSTGALDVYIIPVYMKKNRPGHILNVLCAETDVEKLSNLILEETTSLGVRVESSITRRCLKRGTYKVQTEWGKVRIKIAGNDDENEEIVNAAPEYEDCRKLAEEHGIPLKRVYSSALYQFEREYRR